MRRRPGLREGRPLRLLAVFALTVLLPALGLAALSWRSVAQEKRALQAERESGLRRAAWLIRKDLADTLERLRSAEEGRPYFQYNPLYFDENFVGQNVSYVQSPIALLPPDPLVEGYFQIDPRMELFSPNDREVLGQQQGIRDDQIEAQQEKTNRALDNARQTLLPRIRRDREIFVAAEKGRFPGVAQQGSQQWVNRQAVALNTDTRKKVQQIREGKQEDAPPQQTADIQVVEVVASPLLFQVDDEHGLLAYRYVDVPNVEGAYENRPVLRYVQGFSIDESYLIGTMFPEIRERYLDVPGARADLVIVGSAMPPGRVVFEDGIPDLTGYRLVVTDDEPAWVERRVSRLATVLLLASGGLLLVIGGGLLFTLRTVREEVRLARRKSDFVSAVTHELRTPLTGIKMYADLLKAGWVKDDSTRTEYVGFMADEADRLARLVNRVLDFARMERGQRRGTKPLDLEGPVREVERDFGPFMSEKGFDLRIEIGETCPALACADAVKQVLLNLLENAVKYAATAEDRTVKIRVTSEGAEVVLSVADHGPGVPEGERSRIFTDFYRTGDEMTRETTGAGIGLALVRRLAESMGGRAEVRDTPGGGATFRVILRSGQT